MHAICEFIVFGLDYCKTTLLTMDIKMTGLKVSGGRTSHYATQQYTNSKGYASLKFHRRWLGPARSAHSEASAYHKLVWPSARVVTLVFGITIGQVKVKG